MYNFIVDSLILFQDDDINLPCNYGPICLLTQGSNYTIMFSFKPQRTINSLTNKAYAIGYDPTYVFIINIGNIYLGTDHKHRR